jgi:hypothetical protein
MYYPVSRLSGLANGLGITKAVSCVERSNGDQCIQALGQMLIAGLSSVRETI